MPYSTTTPSIFTIDSKSGFPIKFKISRTAKNIAVAVGTEVVDY
jgi:hypothetical protein